ncbi:MAG: hypothetical protein JW754_00620 [Candidatus Aenigmarchaeota archaeon]|nr:hypothetical protein [Candidatus Aenigmarchaeota archaeon]
MGNPKTFFRDCLRLVGYIEASRLQSDQAVPDIAKKSGNSRPVELETDGFCRVGDILRSFEKPIGLGVFSIENPVTGKTLTFGVGYCIEQAYNIASGVPLSEYPSGCLDCPYLNNTMVKL